MSDLDTPKHRLTRRSLLKRLFGAAVGRLLITGSLLSVQYPARAQYAEGIAIASTAMNLMLSFSKRGNAMGAMLGAIRELQLLTIQQLGAIQVQLGSIIASIDALPDQLKTLLRQQYQYELTSELIGAANRYQTYLRAAQVNQAIFEAPEVRQQLQNILNVVQGHRSTLAVSDHGCGPEACIIVPVACALEVAALTRLQFPKDVVIAVLNDYRNWLQNILSSRPGAIAAVQSAAIASHDNALSVAEKLPRWHAVMADPDWEGKFSTWDGYFNLEQFKIGAKASGSYVGGDDSCFILSNAPQVKLAPLGTVGAGQKVALWRSVMGNSSRSLTIQSSISAAPNDQGIQLLEYRRGLRVYGALNRVGGDVNEEGFWPKATEACYMESVSTLPNGVDDMIKAVEESKSWKIEMDGAERQAFIAKLSKANEERMRIGLCVRAATVALESDNRIREHLLILGSRP